MATATSWPDPELLARARECPILDGTSRASYRAAIAAASELSVDLMRFLERKPPEEQAAWIATSVRAGRVLLQPWSVEVLLVLGVKGRARYGELHRMLGLSSRTLSDKLAALRDAGFIDREVFDERPVRIEYFLTRQGRASAAAATTLFAQLNLAAVRAAGRLPARGQGTGAARP